MFHQRADQGEVHVRRIEKMPEGLTEAKPENGVFIIGHSESGHHHVISADGATVMERPTTAGLNVLYALLEKPNELKQDAPSAHGTIPLMDGIYEFRISREYDHFSEQAGQVAD